MRCAILAVVVAAALFLPAAVAQADDKGVYGTYVSRDADFARLGKQLRSGLRSWKHSHYKRPAQALSALNATTVAIDQLRGSIKAEDTSSDHGTRAKAAALASLRYLRGSAVALRQSVTAVTHRHAKRGLTLSRQSDRLAKKAAAAERRARREFKAAGVQVTQSPA